MTPFDIIKYKGCTIKLYQDEDPGNPREDDNVGEILYTSTRYNLGDRQVEAEEIRAITERQDVVWLPVYAYIHSGTRLNTTGFSCPWDSGQCGIIWCTKKNAVYEWGKKLFTKVAQQKAEKYLRGEIETFNAFLAGDVIGYRTEGPAQFDEDGDEIEEGEDIDSCWGFYPEDTEKYSERYKYAIGEAKSSIDHWLEKRAQQVDQHLALT